MGDWTPEQLDRVGAGDEVEIASYQPDVSLRPWVTVWVVRVGDDLYVRSHTGRQGTWFRHAVQCHEGRAHAGGVERDVVFEETALTGREAIDQAYQTKYARYGDTYIVPMVSPAAATPRLIGID